MESWEMDIQIPVVPIPVSITLILLGILSILYIFPEMVNFFRVVFKRPKLPYIEKLVTRISMASVGIFLIMLGFYLLLKDTPTILSSSACIYSKEAQTDTEAIHWLIEQEAQAVAWAAIETEIRRLARQDQKAPMDHSAGREDLQS